MNRRTGRRMMLDSYDRRWDRRFPALTGIKRGLIELHAQLPAQSWNHHNVTNAAVFTTRPQAIYEALTRSGYDTIFP